MKDNLNKLMTIIVWIARTLAGIVFIFSGFVKAVDPWGSTYKFIDYYNDAFGMGWLEPTALPMAFILSALEFLVGVGLLLNLKVKLSAWIALLFMIVFTPLTLYLAIADPVHDCGCFGDAIVLSNWETFGKNIIISLLVVVTFVYRNKIKPYFDNKRQWGAMASIAMLVFVFQIYNFRHLPVVDFRAYKVGTNIHEKMIIPEGAPHDEYEMFLTLEDTTAGKQIEIEMDKYMKDSTYWMQGTKWKFISQSEPRLIKKGYTPPINNLSITNSNGENILEQILADDNYCFWLIAYNMKKADTDGLLKGNEIAGYCKKNGYKFYFLTASPDYEVEEFRHKHNEFTLKAYATDPITLKTIVRAHPGLVLLKDGKIIDKWNYRDFPSDSELDNLLK